MIDDENTMEKRITLDFKGSFDYKKVIPTVQKEILEDGVASVEFEFEYMLYENKIGNISGLTYEPICAYLRFAKELHIKGLVPPMLHLTSAVPYSTKNIDILCANLIVKYKEIAETDTLVFFFARIMLPQSTKYTYTMSSFNRADWINLNARIKKEYIVTLPKGLEKLELTLSQTIRVKIGKKFDVNNLRYYFPLRKHYDNISLVIEMQNQELEILCRANQLLGRLADKYSITLPRAGESTSASDLFSVIEITNINGYYNFEEEIQTLHDSRQAKNLTESWTNSGSFDELIYEYLLRSYEESKERIPPEESVALSNIRANAKSYAEGLWQIIENAIEHSCGHSAFFGMRIHQASIKSMSNLKNNSGTRVGLWEKFWYNHNVTDNIFNQSEYTMFLEFYVLDSALDGFHCGKGILDVIRDDKRIETKPERIRDVFSMSESDYDYNDHLSYYTKHYGMQLLKRHIEKMNGLLEVFSPYRGDNPTAEQSWYCNQFKDDTVSANYASSALKGADLYNLYATEYNILLPLPYLPPTDKVASGILEYDADYIGKMIIRYTLCIDCDLANDIGIGEKDLLVAKLMDVLDTQLPCSDEVLSIIMVKQRIFSPLTIEIFTKSLFSHIYNIKKKQTEKKLRFAIIFDSPEAHVVGVGKDDINEFVRLFSIFYVKMSHTPDNYMKGVQIACCNEQREINFVIAGSNFASAYQTANNFVYYDAKCSLPYISLLHFLCEDNKNSEETNIRMIEKLFPFDLYFSINDLIKDDVQTVRLSELRLK